MMTGSKVDAVTFITSKGNKSPKFEGKGGNYYLLTIPNGCRICGTFGRSGGVIDKLGFLYN